MTRKHYVAIAEIIKDKLVECKHGGRWPSDLVEVTQALAKYFASENPPNATGGGFDKARFLNACGIEVSTSGH